VRVDRRATALLSKRTPTRCSGLSQGHTEQEAIDNIREAIVGCLEVRAAQGLPLTVRTVEIV
jgi:predicted RNase H-like HicB family nuclease